MTGAGVTTHRQGDVVSDWQLPAFALCTCPCCPGVEMPEAHHLHRQADAGGLCVAKSDVCVVKLLPKTARQAHSTGCPVNANEIT